MLRALRSFSDSVRAHPGCAGATILREVSDRAALVYAESWRDDAHFEQHVVAAAYDLVLVLIESSAEQPTVEFRFGAEIRGLAWLERLRQRARTAGWRPGRSRRDDEVP